MAGNSTSHKRRKVEVSDSFLDISYCLYIGVTQGKFPEAISSPGLATRNSHRYLPIRRR